MDINLNHGWQLLWDGRISLQPNTILMVKDHFIWSFTNKSVMLMRHASDTNWKSSWHEMWCDHDLWVAWGQFWEELSLTWCYVTQYHVQRGQMSKTFKQEWHGISICDIWKKTDQTTLNVSLVLDVESEYCGMEKDFYSVWADYEKQLKTKVANLR